MSITPGGQSNSGEFYHADKKALFLEPIKLGAGLSQKARDKQLALAQKKKLSALLKPLETVSQDPNGGMEIEAVLLLLAEALSLLPGFKATSGRSGRPTVWSKTILRRLWWDYQLTLLQLQVKGTKPTKTAACKSLGRSTKWAAVLAKGLTTGSVPDARAAEKTLGNRVDLARKLPEVQAFNKLIEDGGGAMIYRAAALVRSINLGLKSNKSKSPDNSPMVSGK